MGKSFQIEMVTIDRQSDGRASGHDFTLALFLVASKDDLATCFDQNVKVANLKILQN